MFSRVQARTYFSLLASIAGRRRAWLTNSLHDLSWFELSPLEGLDLREVCEAIRRTPRQRFTEKCLLFAFAKTKASLRLRGARPIGQAGEKGGTHSRCRQCCFASRLVRVASRHARSWFRARGVTSWVSPRLRPPSWTSPHGWQSRPSMVATGSHKARAPIPSAASECRPSVPA
jgi:hypothetical protein